MNEFGHIVGAAAESEEAQRAAATRTNKKRASTAFSCKKFTRAPGNNTRLRVNEYLQIVDAVANNKDE
jgi:hypothetical protein